LHRHEDPAEIHSASPRPYGGLPELTYPLHDRDVVVTACGRICMHRKRISHVFANVAHAACAMQTTQSKSFIAICSLLDQGQTSTRRHGAQ